jgi:hypothetical protein
MSRRACLHTLLALLLLLAQQFTAAHALSHWDEGYLHKHACELCATSAQLNAGLPSTTPSLEPTGRTIERPSFDSAAHTPRLHLPFRSRAPPSAVL